MPVTLNTGISYFDGPPIVRRAGFCVHNGKLTDIGTAMLPMSAECTGIAEKLTALEKRFHLRAAAPVLAAS